METHPTIKQFYESYSALRNKALELIKVVKEIDVSYLYHYDNDDPDESYDERPTFVTTTRRGETIWDSVNKIRYNETINDIVMVCEEMGEINITYCEGLTEVYIFETIIDHIEDNNN
jgi:hypothetical protein